jgi:type I restriction enzyme S subunit
VEWYVEGGTIKRLYNTNIAKTRIPNPPLDLQERIVAILDKFETLVNDLSQGLPAEIAAVQEQYEYYRNKLLTFKQVA